MPTPEHNAAIQQAMCDLAGSVPTAAQASANFQANLPALREALGGVSAADAAVAAELATSSASEPPPDATVQEIAPGVAAKVWFEPESAP